MKKNLFIIVFIGFAFNSFCQKAANKKIQAGIITGFGLNFTNPTTKYISRNGVGTDFSIGMNINYNYTSNIGFSSGVEFDFETIKLKTDSSLYYVYNDTEILTKSQYSNTTNIFSLTEGKVYKLNSRNEKPIYLTIPTMLLFRTDYIGFMRYFGKFGLRNSILLSNTINDSGFSYDNDLLPKPVKNENMKTSHRDLSLFKSFIGISGGTEWNFIGTTSLVFELGFYYGFLNISRGTALIGDDDKNLSIITNHNTSALIYNSLPAKQNQLLLKVSILF